ncbi:O-methyltransferase involved in polyketide biosynthesis [Allocatelliglobosispora scoriae]|uniref:O-methyltransferase involved in polyketide biosynthesis n=1 Tax=Allocatelliglobosispora scoriae TaxID=643052 RepID=A0A841BK92_9ACTN|nr:SAM-dependent methyltransferase [Allocatelliglobosispora scoriae]MBB5867646.1 O-methyltransferase involved in polyketide biosynthesis [Allocatelliglobosispora scoriae]
MQTWDDGAPDGLATDRPNVARMYDYYLGGSHNYPADREMAQRVIATYPALPEVARLNRAFLGRVVRFLSDAGIRQFVDLGSGLPTVGNVHQIVQSIDPGARVVYVDHDEMAVLYSRVMLVGNPGAAVVQGDITEIRQVFRHRDLRCLIDFKEPVAVLLFGLLHFVSDGIGPMAIIDEILQTVASGSYLALSHASRDGLADEADRIAGLYARSGSPMAFRSHAEIAAFFADFPLVEPGLVPMEIWRPDEAESAIAPPVYSGYGGVGQKP